MAEQARLAELSRREKAANGSRLADFATRPRGRRCRTVVLVAGLVGVLGAASFAGDGAVELTLSPTGDRLGPLEADTSFDAAELQALFPSATVAEATGSTEGEPYPMLRIEADDDDEVLLEIRSVDGASIDSVEIMAGTEVADLNVHHGDTYEQVFPAGSTAACEPGIEEASGQVACLAPQTAHVTILFDGSWDGPDGELPPPEVLSAWTVGRILWWP